jgi:CheY-like chemotaxis protein
MLAEAPPAAPARPTGLPAAAEGLRVLLVDDNVDGADSLAALVRLAGHDTRVAHDGPGALEAAAAFRPQVVVLDIGLPGLTGYEVARRLRADPDLAGASLVAVTGYGRDEDRERAREAGFDHHLTKPVEFAQLLDLLKPPAAVPAGR